jgi:hypothetical protein
MGAAQIEKKVKYIRNAEGRSTEVILPYGLFKELLELKANMEIYERKEVQQSLRRAQKDVVSCRTRSFHRAVEAIAWLKQ